MKRFKYWAGKCTRVSKPRSDTWEKKTWSLPKTAEPCPTGDDWHTGRRGILGDLENWHRALGAQGRDNPAATFREGPFLYSHHPVPSGGVPGTHRAPTPPCPHAMLPTEPIVLLLDGLEHERRGVHRLLDGWQLTVLLEVDSAVGAEQDVLPAPVVPVFGGCMRAGGRCQSRNHLPRDFRGKGPAVQEQL